MPHRFQASQCASPRSSSRSAWRPLALGALAALLAGAPPVHAQATAGLTVDPAGADDALAVARFDEARALYDAGLFGPAARALARFRDAYPRDARAPEALFLHAESALASGDPESAAALFLRFEADYPGSLLAPRARAALGRYYYATGDDVRAEAALTAALDRPGDPITTAETAYLLGMTQRRQNRPEAAAAAFQRAAEADTPTAPAALYALGTVRIGRGDAAGVVDAFEALATRYPDSPENAQVRLALSEAYLRTDRLADALAEAERRRPALTGDDAERADLTIGETYVRLGQTDAALAPLRAVPAEGRYGRRAALALGRALYARGDASGASTALATVRTPATGAPPPGT
ncbi:MAG TPA: tetratricopeptide repeat protein, partial [Rubricoccaceae bacterium]